MSRVVVFVEMGSAASVLTSEDPNLENFGRIINRYEELKRLNSNLDHSELHEALISEIRDIYISKRSQEVLSSGEKIENQEEKKETPPRSSSNRHVSPPYVDSGRRKDDASGMNSGVSDDEDVLASILVVDDSALSLKLAKRALRVLEFNIEVAASGEEALQILRARAGRFILVILDIVMPGMDGVQVLSAIKENQILQNIPVCMLSGLADQTLADVCLESGAVEVLIKPLKVEAVRRVIDLYCGGGVSPMSTDGGDLPGEMAHGATSSPFILPDQTFTPTSLSDLTNHEKKSVLLVFFPIAFGKEDVLGTWRLFKLINKHFSKFTSTNTTVVGVGKELPYVMNALKIKWKLKFPILSDPDLHITERFVGTFDLGSYMTHALGMSEASVSQFHYMAPNLGAVLLAPDGRVVFKWIGVDSVGDPNLWLLPKLTDLMAVAKSLTPLMKSNVGESLQTRRFSVLLVDDSIISKKLTQKVLLSLGLEMGFAENGQEALDLLRRCPTDYDLILSDIVMPIVDGIELVSTIKREELLTSLPVVMLSGLNDDMLTDVCLESGAEQVIFKPLKEDIMRQLMETYIRK